MPSKTKEEDRSKGLLFEVEHKPLDKLNLLIGKEYSKEIINLLELVDYYNLQGEIKAIALSFVKLASKAKDDNIDGIKEYYTTSLNKFGKEIDKQVKKLNGGEPDLVRLNKEYVSLVSKLEDLLTDKNYIDTNRLKEFLEPLNYLKDSMSLVETADYLEAFDKDKLEKLREQCTYEGKFFAIPFMLMLYHSSENKLFDINSQDYLSNKLEEFIKNGLRGKDILGYLLHEIKSNYKEALKKGLIKENPFEGFSDESLAIDLLYNYKFGLLSIGNESEPRTLESIEIENYKYKKMERDNSDMYN